MRINAEDPKYVCRAGFKLEKALDHFGVDVTGATALDSGLSTGGFTHCLLQRGARHVSRVHSTCSAGCVSGACHGAGQQLLKLAGEVALTCS